jgi:neutral ceramidase
VSFKIGVARRVVTPPLGVELAGLGYYLKRTWARVRDNLHASALVLSSEEPGASVALVAVDLMYNDRLFVHRVREQVAAHTELEPDSVCINFSHSHNAPTAGFIRGAGEQDTEYLKFAAGQTATAIIEASKNRQPAKLYSGSTNLDGLTYNRTRENGPVDSRVSVLYAEGERGQPLAAAVNFHAHPCAYTANDFRAVSRDVPGELVDQLEAALPGLTALYLQGTCGDVNFSTAEPPGSPARILTDTALTVLSQSRLIESSGVGAVRRSVLLPTRRWTHEEVNAEREEGVYRLKTGDVTGWLNGIARAVVNQPQRLPERYGGSIEHAVAAVSRFALEWTDAVLPDLDTRPETLETEIQVIRVGNVYLAAHSAELFSTLGLELRNRWQSEDLFVLGYSNGSIGYMPDEYDVARRGYGAYTSPKCTGQFPFTAESGPVLVGSLIEALRASGARSHTVQDHITQ